jgi:hypothetical protein
VDFRSSEKTNFEEFKKSSRYPGDLKKNETFLFISKGGEQLLWILNVKELPGVGKTRQVIDSRKWRIDGGAWNPMMLKNYAKLVGLDLVGLKSFEETYEEERERKKAA